MKKTLTILLYLGLLAGCDRQQAKTVSNGADFLTNLPPDVAEYAKTPEGQQILEIARKMNEHVDLTKDVLIHKTDHRAVLSASRDVLRTRHDFQRDTNWHGPGNSHVSMIAPDDPKVPLAIRKLGAASILVSDGWLCIEFGGGFHHYGFLAYSEISTNVQTT